jgi:hypothetical protein
MAGGDLLDSRITASAQETRVRLSRDLPDDILVRDHKNVSAEAVRYRDRNCGRDASHAQMMIRICERSRSPSVAIITSLGDG